MRFPYAVRTVEDAGLLDEGAKGIVRVALDGLEHLIRLIGGLVSQKRTSRAKFFGATLSFKKGGKKIRL